MKYLICNLKGHKTYEEINNYLNELIANTPNVIIAPSPLYLELFKRLNISLASQDIPLFEEKKLTGDITIEQYKSMNVTYTFLGHYERKAFYQEDDYKIIKKANKAFQNNLKVILFIGESKEELMRHVEFQVIGKKLIKFLNHINRDDFKNLIIAYEPTYMIGVDNQIDINHIFKMISFIKELVEKYYHYNIDIVYGGNVNLNNVDSLLKVPNLDGLVLGTSALEVNNVNKIFDKMTIK